jgi:hypothetical protein
MKTIFRQLLLCAIACLGSGSRADDDKAFNNNFAEAESWHYYSERDRWPKNLADLASFSKARCEKSNIQPRFSPENYRTIGFANLANGDLQLTLTSHSGKSQVRVCKRPLTTAMAIIQQEGYLIVQNGSSFCYFDKENTFCNGPLGWSGRAMHGSYTTITPWSFTGEVTTTYFNSPGTPIKCQMKMEVYSVERDSEPFDSRNLFFFWGHQKGKQPFPTNPVAHRACFVFNSLIPVLKQEKAP